MKSLERLGLKLGNKVSLNELLSENFNPQIYGLTRVQGEKVNALRDIVTTYLGSRDELEGKTIRRAEDAVGIAGGHLRSLDHEELWVAFLNKANVVMSFEMIFKGALDAVNISNRDIIAKALSKGATNIIVFHNHPSGCPTPSVSDIEQTSKLTKACKLMQIGMIDHIIIGASSYFSFSDECTCNYRK